MSAVRWTEEQLQAHRSRVSLVTVPKFVPQTVQPIGPKFKSKTEARFAQLLDAYKSSGEIYEWRYEPITLKLGSGVRYTPDFLVIAADGWRLIEVKGEYIRPVGRVKYKTAATLFPFVRLQLAQYKNNDWTVTEVERG